MHLRNDWTRAETQALYQQPFLDLVFQAQQIHRQYFEANAIQVSTLLSIKTGKCPEDCKYCSQSARYDSKLEAEKRIAVEKVISEAQQAKASGSTRFCMGAAWRNPHERDMPYVLDMVREVKALGLETCMTLGMLNAFQAERFPINTPQNKEEYYYRSIFAEHFPSDSAARSVPSVPSVACSTAEALAWDDHFKKINEPSGRAVIDVHENQE